MTKRIVRGRWRELARPIVEQVLAATEGEPPSTVKFALQQAYPFGERKYFPYKAWLAEVKYQLAQRVKRETFDVGSLFD